METQTAQYEENTKQQTAILTKAQDDIKTMKTELDEKAGNLEKFQDLFQQHLDIVGCVETADELTDWVEKMAQEQEEEQAQKDAIRMLGELQLKTNLLEEQLAKIREEGYKVSKAKSKKGLSGSHRQEKIDNGVLECFHPDRCCAMVWANGKGSQCSRHWDKNPDGKWSKVCLTHQKHISEDRTTWTGSFGLYHQQRPATWGEHGLYVQNEYKSRTGKPICWKMKQAEYLPQFESDEFQSSIPTEQPRYDYPDLKVEKVLAEFSSDEEDEDDDQSVHTIAFSESDGGNDVADLNDVADVETPDGTDEEVVEVVEEKVEAEEELVCEQCGKKESEGDWEFDGPAITQYAVNGKNWCPDCISDDCQSEKTDEDSDDNDGLDYCGKCGDQVEEFHGAIDGVEMCFDCHRHAEYAAQNLKASSDEESE